jgi:hypothetical protein
MTAADVILRFPEETCDGHVADTNRYRPPGLMTRDAARDRRPKSKIVILKNKVSLVNGIWRAWKRTRILGFMTAFAVPSTRIRESLSDTACAFEKAFCGAGLRCRPRQPAMQYFAPDFRAWPRIR